jgi:hypothetical protein
MSVRMSILSAAVAEWQVDGLRQQHCSRPQSNQSAGPVRFVIFCSISIILLASPVAGRKPQWTAGAE